MSIEPPKTGKGMPGAIVILAFLSILLLMVIGIFGALAFDVNLPGRANSAPDPASALSASDFDIVSSATGKDTATLQVDLVVTNTSGQTVEDAQVLVQCEDGGYVSAIQNVPPLESEAKTVVQMQLNGTGAPACAEPDISFSPMREGE